MCWSGCDPCLPISFGRGWTHCRTHPEGSLEDVWVWHVDVRWALPVAARVVDSFWGDSTFSLLSCKSWAGCQLRALRKLLSASEGSFVFFLCLFSVLGEVLGFSVLFSPPLQHMYVFCPLFWQWGCSVLYAKQIWRLMTFSESLSMREKSGKCWWFGQCYLLIETQFRGSLHARDGWLFESWLLGISWLRYLQYLAMRSLVVVKMVTEIKKISDISQIMCDFI